MAKIVTGAKRSGDLMTSQMYNDIINAINENADVLDGHTTSIGTINETIDAIDEQTQQNTQAIRNISQGNIRQVFLTQVEYDAMVANNQIEPDVLYNIYE